MSADDNERAILLSRLKDRLDRLAVLVERHLHSAPANQAQGAGAAETPEIAHRPTRGRRPQTLRRASG
jgi:hypothetical protein